MSEESNEHVAPATTGETTGHDAVDGVLASLESLDETPVSDQVPVFEAAHETLRAALADAGNDPA